MEGQPRTDPVDLAEAARRVVAARLARSMTRQGMRYLRVNDAKFPPRIGQLKRRELFEWREIEAYFREHHRTRGENRRRDGNAPGGAGASGAATS